MVHTPNTTSFIQGFLHIQCCHGGEELPGDDVSGEIILGPGILRDFTNQPVKSINSTLKPIEDQFPYKSITICILGYYCIFYGLGIQYC